VSNEEFESYTDKQAAERKFRLAMAAEAKAEREMREKIKKWFYAVVGVFVALFVVAMAFF
jgi:hypothetical protein